MKKLVSILLTATMLSICLSACTANQKTPMVNSQRRLGKYFQAEENKDGSVVDLSEGPKLDYNANFGPKTPSFEFKIINPY